MTHISDLVTKPGADHHVRGKFARLAEAIAKGEVQFPVDGDSNLADAVREYRRRMLVGQLARTIAQALWDERTDPQ